MTHDELLQKIKIFYERKTLGAGKFYIALRAVVEREESKHPESELSNDHYFYDLGYNQCLADIKADIEKELG